MALTGFWTASEAADIKYPVAPADGTTYEAFGVTVDDNFRPLENDTAAATLAWVAAENEVTGSYLAKIPFRESIRTRLTSLNNYAKTGLASKENDGLWYWSYNDGLKNQAVIYRGTSPYADDAEVFLDPNSLSDDGTVALTGLFQSKDGKYTAYTISRSGSDWSEIYVMDTKTRELLPDHIEWAKFTGAEWNGDGFFYSAYPRPEAGKEFSNANEFHTVYFHRLGTPQEEDVIVYRNSQQPLHFYQGEVTENGQFLNIIGGGQGLGNSLAIKDLTKPDSDFITIEPTQSYTVSVVDVLPDGKLLAFTSYNAPNNRLVVIDPAAPQRDNWTDFLPEDASAVLSGIYLIPEGYIALYEKDASNHAYTLDNKGNKTGEIKFPTFGSAGFSTSKKSPEILYSFSSFTYPSSIYSLDSKTLESRLVHSTKVEGLNSDDYVTEQIFYTSKDGTKIPMFITYKKGLEKNGKNPVYLYGYGGFNVSLPPTFSANRLIWLENGGIYAQANLRGGSEYGEKWHLAGTKMNKQNVFDDFISAAEYMINEGWTSPELLTVEGGSNGGLLIGAVVNQRPELFRVAIPRVGVMDMMRYHLFTIGWNWASDYGTADDSAEMAHYLLGYSPVHNIKNDGTPYPSILVTTADHDDRVVPAHSFKYAAKLQASDTGNNPKLIRIDSKAGHGGGKPIAKQIDEYTDIYSFIFYNLGISPNE